MIQTERKTVGGYPVAITQFDFFRATPLSVRWFKLLAPGIGPLIKSVGEKFAAAGGLEALAEVLEANPLAAIAILDVEKLGDAIAGLAASANPNDFLDLAVQTLACATITIDLVPGQTAVVDLAKRELLDAVFTGRLGLFYQVLATVVWVNFGGFFSDAFTRRGAKSESGTPKPAPSV